MIFENATENDKEEILALYNSLIGTKYCAWTTEYPNMREIDFDLSRNALFCLRDNGKIVGVISIDEDEAVGGLPYWNKELEPSVELSRLGVHNDYQNQGIAGKMITYLMTTCRERGYKGVHFLVSKQNIKAQKAYAKLHFRIVGECSMFDDDFWCYEKSIVDNTQ
ncbi:MAG: GNAT family N-acetyltransferase [Eubacteriales bacterium]|nr:GNAT family N-acetyltransferase [Lachnospiraceae bacterium]MDO5126322.1 GNAT family N-acetyltransferase [Eubacteriales bacterium]